ncbi:MAG: nucleotide pyrophosphohydrolase [Thermococcus sp.]|nr:nucleotide pyrophosphohydrolase [Thermococcus sp.]
MNELQRRVDELISEFGGYWPPFEMLVAIVEEIGELSDVLLRLEGSKGLASPEELKEELGDVMFALACLANHYGIDLFEALSASIDKYKSRDGHRWKGGTT